MPKENIDKAITRTIKRVTALEKRVDAIENLSRLAKLLKDARIMSQ